MLGLVFTLVVIVFLTDTVLILPIIGFPLVVTSASSFIQIISKKIWGPKGKVFRIAPLHHHFEAIGWSREKITMRYWILSLIFAVVGVIVALL
jgi:phospho-N-acetylmuramoyl-pentapeptide-transferase